MTASEVLWLITAWHQLKTITLTFQSFLSKFRRYACLPVHAVEKKKCFKTGILFYATCSVSLYVSSTKCGHTQSAILLLNTEQVQNVCNSSFYTVHILCVIPAEHGFSSCCFVYPLILTDVSSPSSACFTQRTDSYKPLLLAHHQICYRVTKNFHSSKFIHHLCEHTRITYAYYSSLHIFLRHSPSRMCCRTSSCLSGRC